MQSGSIVAPLQLRMPNGNVRALASGNLFSVNRELNEVFKNQPDIATLQEVHGTEEEVLAIYSSVSHLCWVLISTSGQSTLGGVCTLVVEKLLPSDAAGFNEVFAHGRVARVSFQSRSGVQFEVSNIHNYQLATSVISRATAAIKVAWDKVQANPTLHHSIVMGDCNYTLPGEPPISASSPSSSLKPASHPRLPNTLAYGIGP